MGQNQEQRYDRPTLTSSEQTLKGYELAKEFNIPLPPADLPESLNKFAVVYLQSAYHLLNIYRQNPTVGGLIDAVQEVHRYTSNLLDQNPDAANFECKKGCNYCCAIRVATVPLEVLSLARYLKASLKPEEIIELLTRIDEYMAEWDKSTTEEKILKSRMCPLNLDGLCVGHPARPSPCMRYHSYSVRQCERAYKSGLLPIHQQPQQLETVRHNAVHLEACNSAFYPPLELTENLNLDSRTIQLVPALRVALTEDDVAERFFAGEKVFDCAYYPELNEADEAGTFTQLMNDSVVRLADK
ncbi:MAG: hypothetical protein KF836_09470 [Fimbriimonadaceae bacterium]|nr:hypothetical protein [Fimbriimonadaceae bacterium]